uniref:Uncharacterized protein n=1 Tax=Aegilops tauschii subsp. strangulata TaxID=200361 RepID=A0A453IJ81_AEGTS
MISLVGKHDKLVPDYIFDRKLSCLLNLPTSHQNKFVVKSIRFAMLKIWPSDFLYY